MKQHRLFSAVMAVVLALSLMLPAGAVATSIHDIFTVVIPAGEQSVPSTPSPMMGMMRTMAPLAVTGTIRFENNYDHSGVCIHGKNFQAYRIMIPSASGIVSEYTVAPDFQGFFINGKIGGDNKPYTFVNGGTFDSYQAGLYIDSFLRSEDKTKAYELSAAMRAYVEATTPAFTKEAAGVSENEGVTGFDPNVPGGHGTETVTLSGLEKGYYFVMSDAFNVAGLGVTADGCFVPVTSTTTVTIPVKGTVPVIAKEIWHDDLNSDGGAWDVVGDSQIGDDVGFCITSTLPRDVSDYAALGSPFYYYYITDTMSDGFTMNQASLKVCTSKGDGKTGSGAVALGADYYQVYFAGDPAMPTTNMPAGLTTDVDFLIVVDVLKLADDLGATEFSKTNLYTYYTAKLDEDAVIAYDKTAAAMGTNYDTNEVELTYSNLPSNDASFGDDQDDVTHYTYEIGVRKTDENNANLAGAKFQLRSGGQVLSLLKGVTADMTVQMDDSTTQAVPTDIYTIVPAGTSGAVTEIETTQNFFSIRGLNDAKEYILEETQAPSGYLKADPVTFRIRVQYDATGKNITTLESTGANAIYDSIRLQIINKKQIILPSTGGVGTVIFQVTGATLMLGAGLALVMNRRGKEKGQM